MLHLPLPYRSSFIVSSFYFIYFVIYFKYLFCSFIRLILDFFIHRSLTHWYIVLSPVISACCCSFLGLLSLLFHFSIRFADTQQFTLIARLLRTRFNIFSFHLVFSILAWYTKAMNQLALWCVWRLINALYMHKQQHKKQKKKKIIIYPSSISSHLWVLPIDWMNANVSNILWSAVHIFYLIDAEIG